MDSVTSGAMCVTRGTKDSAHDTAFQITRTCGVVHTGLLFALTGTGGHIIIFSDTRPDTNGSALYTGLTVIVTRANTGIILISTSVHGPIRRHGFHRNGARNLSGVLNNLSSHRRYAVSRIVPGLSLVPYNAVPPGPSRLLNSSHVVTLINRLRGRCSCIFVSAPPLNIISSTLILRPISTNVILITHRGRAACRRVRRSVRTVGRISNALLNVILSSIRGHGDLCNNCRHGHCCESCGCRCSRGNGNGG